MIFSAVSKDYDSVKIPHVPDPHCDYILFSDTPKRETGLWQIRPIPFWNQDPTRITRYVKLHPHLLCPGYKAAMWVDQNVLLLDVFHREIEDFLASDCPIGTFYHPTRAGFHEESLACMQLHKDSMDTLKRQLACYMGEKVPEDGLYYTNVVLFNLSHPLLPSLLAAWWAEIERFSKRDQISLPYALKKVNASCHPLARRGICAGNHPKFGVLPHDRNRGVSALIAESTGTRLVDPFAGESFNAQRSTALSKVSELGVDICVCVHNAEEAVRACLSSLIAKRRGKQDKIYILDDGSSSPTREFLEAFAKQYPHVFLFRNTTAEGYTRAANTILSKGTSEYAVLLNSDTIVTDDWVGKMIWSLKESPGAGICGVLSNAADAQSLPEIVSSNDNTVVNVLPKGISADDMNRLCESWAPAHIVPRVPLVHGFCFALTRRTFAILGGFDQVRFPQGYGEENDFSFRASDAGIGQVLAINTYVFHAKSQSFSPDVRRNLMEKGVRTLVAQYGAERVGRACKTMSNHPLLLAMRARARALYDSSVDVNDVKESN
ncbi:MAG: glycosyltransferase [Desulfovibrio sp.]|nr:glycosyltransferase [Desulfovibrio sp.]